MTKSKKNRPAYLRALDNPDESPQLGLPGVEPAPPPPAKTPLPNFLWNSEEDKKKADEDRRRWQEIHNELWEAIPEDMRDGINLSLFSSYVTTTLLYRKNAEKCLQFGSVIKTDSGYMQQSPFYTAQNQDSKNMQKLANELGLTHASRRRAKAEKNKPKRDNIFSGLKTIE